MAPILMFPSSCIVSSAHFGITPLVYQHLEELFKLYIMCQPNNNTSTTLQHLKRYNIPLKKYPPQFLVFVYIITMGPLPQKCNQQMSINLDPRFVTILKRLKKFRDTCHYNYLPHPHTSSTMTSTKNYKR